MFKHTGKKEEDKKKEKEQKERIKKEEDRKKEKEKEDRKRAATAGPPGKTKGNSIMFINSITLNLSSHFV